jgi:bifunctional DNA-binding transcriptional regulator/antitoxin component of YhaV-PrlF toxin-antitoxin module
MTEKGELVLPTAYLRQDQIAAGTEFEIKRLGPGEYLLKRTGQRNISLAEWLMDCPEKDWFTPLTFE